MTTPKWKNDAGVIAARNAADSADADIRVNSIKVTGGSHVAGYILQTDVNGLGAWVLDPALAAAAAAQSTANGAVSVNTTQTADIATAIAAAAAAQATADAASPLLTLPKRGHFHSDEGTYIVGTPSRNIDATYPYDAGLYTTTQNAHVEFYVTCRAGASMTVNILTQFIASAAILTVYLDGSLFGTHDQYNAVTNKAVLTGATSGAVSAGDHIIAVKALTKNASSSGYVMFLNLIQWRVNP